MLCKTHQTFGESRLRCRETKCEHVLVLHSMWSLMVVTSISQALTTAAALVARAQGKGATGHLIKDYECVLCHV